MGVLIEAITVVIRNAAVEARVAGGLQELQRRCPNATFCTDGEICRAGFMTSGDARSYVEGLKSLGITMPRTWQRSSRVWASTARATGWSSAPSISAVE
jgi:hypothetical protein